MKLPGITRLEVQSLGRRDASLPTEGAARIRAAEKRADAKGMEAAEYTRQARKQDLRGAGADFDTLKQELRGAQSQFRSALKIAHDKDKQGSAAQQAWFGAARAVKGVADFSQRNQYYRAERQGQEADIAMQQAYSEFEAKFVGKDFVTPDELAGTVADTAANRARSQIPTSEVLPAMLEEHLNNNIGPAAKLIENEYFRTKWNADATVKMKGVLGKANARANAEYQRQVQVQQSKELSTLWESGNIAQAMPYIDNMLVSDEQKKLLRTETRRFAERKIYQDAQAEGNIEVLQQSFDTLTLPYEDYKAAGGKLGNKERLQYRDQVAGDLAGSVSKKDSMEAARKALLGQQITFTKEHIMSGQPVSAEVMNDIDKKLTQAIAADPTDATLRTRKVEYDILREVAGYSGQMNKVGPGGRDKFIATLDENANKLGPAQQIYQNRVNDSLRKIDKNLTTAENSDMLQSAMTSGHKIEAIDFTNLTASLGQRKIDEAAMKNIYGQSQGYLTKTEANRLNEILSRSNPAQKSVIYQQTFEALGSDAVRLWDQVRVESGSTTASIVGEIVSQSSGNPMAATTTLTGQAYRNNPGNAAEFTTINKIMHLNIMDKIGTLYPHNPSRHVAMKEAVYDTYVGLALEQGEDFTDVSSDILKRAIKMSVGETVTQGGREMPSFTREMKQDEFEEYIATLPDGFFQKLGGVDNGSMGVYPEDKLREEILDGDIDMRTVGAGSYQLWKDGVPLKSRSGDGAFIFEYDPNVIPAERPGFIRRVLNRLEESGNAN